MPAIDRNKSKPRTSWMVLLAAMVCWFSATSAYGAKEPKALPVVDVHIHYSHDAWDRFPPPRVVEMLRNAGVERAFVSSSSDEGTQKLFAFAPELIVPVLRPYRKRGETRTWMHDETVIKMVGDLLSRGRYAGIGEFHAFGNEIELPVLQAMIELADQYGLFLHAHVDADAVKRIFQRNPKALVLWAHSGFDEPHIVQELLERYPNLWADLAFRTDHYIADQVHDDWVKLFERYPNRFMLGTDTYTPERWFYVEDHANGSRAWLNNLPAPLAKRIAKDNALELLSRTRFGQ